jgi:methyl-accepting chemotaxis protein
MPVKEHPMKSRFSALQLLQRWPVARQLGVSFTLVLALMSVLGAASLVFMAEENERAAVLANTWLRGAGLLADARAGLTEVREMEVKHSHTQDGSYFSEYEDKIKASAAATTAALAEYGQAVAGNTAGNAANDVANDATKQLLASTSKAWASYQSSVKNVVALGREKKSQDASDISDGAAAMAFEETLGMVAKLTSYNLASGRAAAEVANATYLKAKTTVLALLGAALAVGAGLAVLITKNLTKQLGGEPAAAVAVAQHVAAGDLSAHIAVRKGDTTSLMACLLVMQTSLAKAVKEVRQGSESVATASQQIASGNLDLSSRTEQQASSLQQTAATMDSLGHTVRNNADNAHQANSLAQGAATVAVRGGDVVNQVVQTMKGINDSSRKIADIISVIDGIAFQTNILALNAAVEAARAGEQGRGFAVVASEVRSLAQRSAEAAKEIKTLISASVARVEEGTAQVDQAGATMQEIVAAIGRVSAIVGEISSASIQQSTGVTQVCDAVGQMDQATQQNAALVEQSAAAAESLQQQARQLVQAVAVFRLA